MILADSAETDVIASDMVAAYADNGRRAQRARVIKPPSDVKSMACWTTNVHMANLYGAFRLWRAAVLRRQAGLLRAARLLRRRRHGVARTEDDGRRQKWA